MTARILLIPEEARGHRPRLQLRVGRFCNTLSLRERDLCAPSQRGVTLIELLAVLAILAMAIAIASPSLFASVDRFQLNSAGRRLVDTFRLARNEARFGQQEISGVLTEGEFVIFRGTSRVQAIELPSRLEVRTSSGQLNYAFLPSGQILGPERLELIGSGRNRGVLILGPPPGTVHFELQQ